MWLLLLFIGRVVFYVVVGLNEWDFAVSATILLFGCLFLFLLFVVAVVVVVVAVVSIGVVVGGELLVWL